MCGHTAVPVAPAPLPLRPALAATLARDPAVLRSDRALCALQRRKDKLPVSKLLLGFFMFVIFGSTLLQLINKVAK